MRDPTKPNYQYIQLISYQIPTLDLTGPPLPQSSPPTSEAVRNLAEADARNRMQRLLDVLYWARNTIPAHLIDSPGDPLSKSNTLKVFIAPEFYFRATAGGYTWNTMFSIMDCLKLVFADGHLADWLIVPGTICAHQPPPQQGGKNTFFNTACIIKGGVKGVFTFVHKERRSQIDGVPPALTDAGLDKDFMPMLGSWKEQKERLFKVDGITFGLDVCLDHLRQALKKTVIDWPKNETGEQAPLIHVHLITACGMSVKPESVAAASNGCVLRCDGKPNAISPTWERSSVLRVVGSGTSDLDKTATLSPQDVGGTNINAPIWGQNVPNAYEVPRPASATNWFQQEVVCYPRYELSDIWS